MRITFTLFAFILGLTVSLTANPIVLSQSNFSGRAFLYVNNNDFENSISGFSIAQDGRLQALPGSPFLTGGIAGKKTGISGLCISRKAKVLFASNNSDNTLSIFKINSDGTLSRTSIPVATGGRFAAGVTCNRQATQAFVANIDSDSISAFNVVNNILQPAPNSPFQAGNGPIDLILNTDNTILFASHQFSHSIGVYSIDSSSRLRLINDVITPGLANHGLSINVNTSRLYVAELGNNSISGFNANLTSGSLSALPNLPYFTDGDKPIALTSSKTGQFIFVSNNNNSTISVFSSNSDGSLRAIAGSPFTTDGQGPASMVMNKKSTLLFVANGGFAGTRDISVYNVSTSGVITPIFGSPFPTNSVGIPSAIGILEIK
ncbi:MAG: beta-propeller fold lactonase family protein [Acidobacteria bacterium]|nr:beta-propeller fold lactonase family protein [Acidobacteriota bacterium]